MEKSKIYTGGGDRGMTSLIGGYRVAKTHLRLEAYGTVDELNSFIGLLIAEIDDEAINGLLLFIQSQLFTVGSYLAIDPTQTANKMENGITGDGTTQDKNGITGDSTKQMENGITGDGTNKMENGITGDGTTQDKNGITGDGTKQMENGITGDGTKQMENGITGDGTTQDKNGITGDGTKQDKNGIIGDGIKRIEEAIDKIDGGLPKLKAFVLPGGSRSAALAHVCRTVCRRAERAICRLAETEKVDDAVLVFINRLSDLLFVIARKECVDKKKNEIFWDNTCK